MRDGNAARSYAERWMQSPLSNPTRRPRVAHVITRLIVGGAQENTLASVVEHRRRVRFASDLILGPTLGPEGSLVSEARTCGVEPRLVASLRRQVNPLMDAIALLSLVRVFRRGQYDVVHTRCFRHQLLLPRPYLVLTKPLRLDIQCQRAASVKIGWKYLLEVSG